jgi:hypothetical protein
MLKQWSQSDGSEKSPPRLSGGGRKALQKELVKSRTMTGILAERSEEKRRVEPTAFAVNCKSRSWVGDS